MTDAAGAGDAKNASVDTDDSYAAALRKAEGDEAKNRIAAAERSVEKAREHLAAQEKELAKAKKENG